MNDYFRGLNNFLSAMDRSNRKSGSTYDELNSTINQLDIIDNCRLFSNRIQFFSSSHGTFPKTDHILGPKIHINKLKRIEIIQWLLRPQWNLTRNQ